MRLLAAAAMLISLAPVGAWAQRSYCITPHVQCPAPAGRLPGAPCRCPGSVTATGSTARSGGDGSDYFPSEPSVGIYSRREILNDDLEQGDEVLAGPRWHRGRRGSRDVLREPE